MNGLRITRCALVWLGFILTSTCLQGQTNSWTSSTSGNWEDSTWSLGIPPGAGQTVLVTNHGWKAVSIGSATASNFPQTMTIDALSVTSPGTDTVSTVLFNYAGFQTPFVTQSLNVSNDARVVVLGSALNVQYGKINVDGGAMTQDAASQVSGQGMLLTNGGVYDLVGGSLAVTQIGREDIESSQFHQEGGSNFCYALLDRGEYDLSNGDLVVAHSDFVMFAIAINGNFFQSGGTVNGGTVAVGQTATGSGNYQMSGGTFRSLITYLPAPGNGDNPDGSFFVQSGGTNFSTNLDIGSIAVPSQISEYDWFGRGFYTLSDGMLVTSSMAINGRGGFTQSGGVHSNALISTTATQFFHQEQPGGNSYLFDVLGYYSLSGGTLVSGLVDMEPGNFDQTGGSAQIGTLQMGGGQCSVSGGQLTVSNINLSAANFVQTGGTLTQSGTLSLAGASLTGGPGSQQLGRLLLAGGNCTITFPSGNCALYFLNSSGLVWSNASTLTISNWNGALFGGGAQRIHFGYDNTGLTAQQISQVQFLNPAGLAAGTYPARILSSGELVPISSQGQGSGSGTANSWISQTGGNWDDASSWSLGVSPNSTQDIFFTNAYWKAVTIDSSTVSSAPQSLAVKSLTITSVSPTNGAYTTRNTLLLNYAQPGNPLVIGVDTNSPGSFLIDSNSTVAMYYSGLIVNDAPGESNSPLGNFQVDGNFIQSDNSEVVAGFLDLNGTYNMTNGQLYVGTQFINGAFNQQGGTNTGAVVDGTNSVYNLFDGALKGDLTLYPSLFQQWGGMVSGQFTFAGGQYKLNGGLLLPGDLNIGALPVPEFFNLNAGGIMQSGGTNNPDSLILGKGYYYLNAGVLNASTMTLTTNTSVAGLNAGYFEQNGGYVTNGELIMIGGTNENGGQSIIAPAKYYLYQGTFDVPSITMNFGNIVVAGIGFNATNHVAALSMNAASTYIMGNGSYVSMDNIVITNGSQFWHQGGSLSGAKNITLGNGEWVEATAASQLGQLRLLSGTNSSIYLPGSGVLQFSSSSGVPWANDGRLTIYGWSGSFSGGGAQEILFGNSASGLAAQQLSQVQFANPAGLPDGTYGAKILSTGEVVPDQSVSSAGPVNSWINFSSGNWDDAASWSLGILPNSSQSVLIVNTNWKAVAINPSTPINFPASMTVSNLFIHGDTNTENTLLLNNFGTAVPLTVLNNLILQDGAQILNFNSGLIVQGGSFDLTNSDVIQDGGFVRATNASMDLNDSTYTISNGVFQVGSMALGFPRSAHFNQYGGSVMITNIGFSSYIPGTIPNGISLYGGTLDLPGGMFLYGEQGGVSYFQAGGTNRTGQVTIAPDYGGFVGGVTLNGGLLADSGVELMTGYETPMSMVQNGGSHVITNSLYLIGGSTHGNSDPVTYYLNGGSIFAGTIELNADQGDSFFDQTNATTSTGRFFAHSTGFYSSFNTYINLSGGTLSCSNYVTVDGNGHLNQSGGALVASNLFSFTGSRDVGGPGYPLLYGHYNFSGGTLTASNINMGGTWIIGPGTNRISNPGTFTLSHLLQIGDAAEQLGHFILASNSTIDLAGSASQLSFANSSGQAWNSGTTLVISDWNGNSAGGGAEQLKFGTDQSGLTSAQLAQIQFRVGTNFYSAKILNTGEVVPDQQVSPSLAFTQQGNQLTLNWPSGYTLQSAASPAGPFQNVTDPFPVTSPYTVNMTDPQRYFRIVPQ
jgi:hypothetical protein